jgi:sugar phosphate isomerase/epimerase
MEDRHHRNREMFLRLKAFGASHTEIPATTVWPQLLTDLNSVVADLDGHVSSEEVGKGAKLAGTATRGAAREALRDDIEAIVRTARVIGETQPGFDDKFRMPRGDNDQAMLDLARGIAELVADAAVKAEFLKHAMPSDFVEDLSADIAALQDAIGDQYGGRADIKSAGVSIDETDAHGVRIARAMDVVVNNFYRNNAAVLAEWETARHVERAPRKKKTTPAEPPKP